jgi:hypothetical protein
MEMTLDHALAIEAKAMVALAFRNGPIEVLHAGKPCAVCSGKNDSGAYVENLALGQRYTMLWDDPELKKPVRKRPPTTNRNP